MILQDELKNFRLSKKKISNCYIINQERFHAPGTAGASPESNAQSQARLKTADQNGRRSQTSSKQGSRPKSALKQLQGLVKQHQADKKHHSKMKQQNFHISGVDYDYLAAAGL